MRKKLLGETHPDVAGSLTGLAAVLRDEGKPAEAEPLVREALAIRRELFGSEHPAVAGSLNTLGGLLETQRKLSDAENPFAMLPFCHRDDGLSLPAMPPRISDSFPCHR